jgi:NAD(P)H-dependent FMN reductase
MGVPKIGIVLGTTRANRFSEKAGRWLLNEGAGRADLEFELVDLRDYQMPFFDEQTSPAFAPPQSAVARRWAMKVGEYDGFVFVTAEYNHGAPSVLKNALDYAYNEWQRKPVAFFGYGGVGGARAIEHLRLICIELQMAPISRGVHIAGSDFMKVITGKEPISALTFLPDTATRMFDELSWWAQALAASRSERG